MRASVVHPVMHAILGYRAHLASAQLALGLDVIMTGAGQNHAHETQDGGKVLVNRILLGLLFPLLWDLFGH